MTIENRSVIEKRFPFILADNDIQTPTTFETNEDFKIDFQKRFKNIDNFYTSCTLDLKRDEFIEFKEYVFTDLDSSRNMFYVQLNINGTTEEYIADFVSNISVDIQGYNNYNLKFDLAIRSKDRIFN